MRKNNKYGEYMRKRMQQISEDLTESLEIEKALRECLELGMSEGLGLMMYGVESGIEIEDLKRYMINSLDDSCHNIWQDAYRILHELYANESRY